MPAPNRVNAQTQADLKSAQHHRGLLYNRVPLVGDWLRGRALAALAEMIQRGSGPAAAALAEACDDPLEQPAQVEARRLVRGMRHASCWEAAWETWAGRRGPELERILRERGIPAAAKPTTKTLSALLLNHEPLLRQADADMAGVLMSAREDDPDELMRGRARFALAKLERPEAVSAVCKRWASSREAGLLEIIRAAGYLPDYPPDARVLTALATNRLGVVTEGGAEVVGPLTDACIDADVEIQAMARFCLRNLRSPAAVSAACSQWARERDPLLEETIVMARYVATRPAAVRVLSALKTGRVDVAAGSPSASLEHLLAALKDRDAEIRERAGSALRGLTREDTRDALCQMFTEGDDPTAREICLEAGYAPSQPDQRALFLFLTGQTAAYETLDFDQSLLNAVYMAASAGLRQRILQAVQQAGRTDFLTILTGADVRARAGELNAIEAQLLVRVLAHNREWERLWLLGQETALPASVEIVRLLMECGWRPAEAEQERMFARLSELAQGLTLTTGAELLRALPVAVARARLKLNGRLNDLAFSPNGRELAIGTGARTVVYWDLQQGEKTGVARGFNRTIGHVAYLPEGGLVCAERTTGNGACGVYQLEGDRAVQIGLHLGSVTALEPLSNGLLLTTGRDQMAALWNPRGGRAEVERALPYWARSACITPDQSEAILLHDRLSRVSLPGLTPKADLFLRTNWNGRPERLDHMPTRSMARSATFAEPGPVLLIGQYNGQVVLVEKINERATARLVTRFDHPVVGVRAIPGWGMFIAGDTTGNLRLIALPGGQINGRLEGFGGRLTSLHTSPDGAFIATGSDSALLTVWDARTQDIPRLFEQPVAAARPADIALVNALAECVLPQAIHKSLLYLQCLLQYRFRFDIHVVETPSIQAGEFDVWID